LGHIITREGILPNTDNIKAIMTCPAPKSITELRSFNGMVQYYGDYIPHLAEIATPLYKLYKKAVEFTWSPACQQAFDTIKAKLTSPPVLRRPDPTLPYILQTDWSPTAIGAGLAQEDRHGEEHPLAFASKILKGPEVEHSATAGECFAEVRFVEHLRPYLCGVPFTLGMDHWSLKWLMTSMQQNGRLARWALKLQEYDFTIRHRKGCLNGNADAHSRPPIACADSQPVAMLAVVEAQPLSFDRTTVYQQVLTCSPVSRLAEVDRLQTVSHHRLCAVYLISNPCKGSCCQLQLHKSYEIAYSFDLHPGLDMLQLPVCPAPNIRPEFWLRIYCVWSTSPCTGQLRSEPCC